MRSRPIPSSTVIALGQEAHYARRVPRPHHPERRRPRHRLRLDVFASGKTTRRSRPEVGDEIMAGSAGVDPGVDAPVAETSVFVGKAVSVGRGRVDLLYGSEATGPRGELEGGPPPALGDEGIVRLDRVRRRDPGIALDGKFVATLIAAVVLYTMGRIAHDSSGPDCARPASQVPLPWRAPDVRLTGPHPAGRVPARPGLTPEGGASAKSIRSRAGDGHAS